MGPFQYPIILIILIGSFSKISAADMEKEPEKPAIPAVMNTTTTSTVTILSERPVNVSYTQNIISPGTKPVLNQADYYHFSNVVSDGNGFDKSSHFHRGKTPHSGDFVSDGQDFDNDYHSHRGKTLNSDLLLPQHRDRQPKSRRLPGGLRSSNPMSMFMTMVSQKMELIARLRELKRNYRDQEQERRSGHRNRESGDRMPRVLRNVIEKGINKFQKHTAMLELFVQFRKDQLQTFMEMPWIASIMENSNSQGEHQRQPMRSHHNDHREREPFPRTRKLFSMFPFFN